MSEFSLKVGPSSIRSASFGNLNCLNLTPTNTATAWLHDFVPGSHVGGTLGSLRDDNSSESSSPSLSSFDFIGNTSSNHQEKAAKRLNTLIAKRTVEPLLNLVGPLEAVVAYLLVDNDVEAFTVVKLKPDFVLDASAQDIDAAIKRARQWLKLPLLDESPTQSSRRTSKAALSSNRSRGSLPGSPPSSVGSIGPSSPLHSPDTSPRANFHASAPLPVHHGPPITQLVSTGAVLQHLSVLRLKHAYISLAEEDPNIDDEAIWIDQYGMSNWLEPLRFAMLMGPDQTALRLLCLVRSKSTLMANKENLRVALTTQVHMKLNNQLRAEIHARLDELFDESQKILVAKKQEEEAYQKAFQKQKICVIS